MSDTQRHLFTSESVTEGHPDKIADQISDAVLDAVLTDDPTGRVVYDRVGRVDRKALEKITGLPAVPAPG